jgi:hypothetical protein
MDVSATGRLETSAGFCFNVGHEGVVLVTLALCFFLLLEAKALGVELVVLAAVAVGVTHSTLPRVWAAA